MLLALVFIPIAAAIAIWAGSPARLTAIVAGIINLVLGLIAASSWLTNPEIGSVTYSVLSKPDIALSFSLYDGMSVVMLLLSVIVLAAAVFSGQCPAGREKLWYSNTLLIAAGAIGAFLSDDLFFFYAFHELALIPTFILIGTLGRRNRKAAAWKITIYLAFGSMVLLAGLLWLVSATEVSSLSFDTLLAASIPGEAQKGIAALLLIGFGTLISLFPFHSWAAPAYASAPAPVAMLHAGVLKKFGLYGLIRLFPLVSEGMQHWLIVLIVLLLGNIIWVGFVTLNQKRLDTMLGNSSVMHMGYVFLAIAALIAAGGEGNSLAIPAAVTLMFAHGVSIALLFALADKVEKQTGTLELQELGGLASKAPTLAFFFGLAGMASIGLPGLANFSGEILVFLSGFANYDPAKGFGPVQIATIIALWGVVISAVYMLRAFRQTFQGPEASSVKSAKNLSLLELAPIGLLTLALLAVGLYPNLILQLLK